MMNQALMVKGGSSAQPISNVDDERELEVPPIDDTFMNSHEEEQCVVNRENAPSGVCT